MELRASKISETFDVTSTTSTTAEISVGDVYNGRISFISDRDWIKVSLSAGESYVFTLYGDGRNNSGLKDPSLRLLDSTGALISSNDDVESGNSFSLISVTPTVTGTYYLEAAGTSSGRVSFQDRFGDYALRSSTNVFTVDQVASQLSDMGFGRAREALYLASSSITYDMSNMDAEAQQLIRYALEAWSVATGLTFVESNQSGSQITFLDEDPSEPSDSFAFTQISSINTRTGVIGSASVYVSDAWVDQYGTGFGSYSYFTFLHEIGHALGLGHGGFYNDSASYRTDAHYENDSHQISIMSYFSPRENPTINASNFTPITPMVADVEAIRSVYQTSSAQGNGNTTWGEGTNIGGTLGTVSRVLFDGATAPSWLDSGRTLGFTITDSGGDDTLDLKSDTNNQSVDLRPGGVSDAYGKDGVLVVGLDTTIENVITGSGHDTIQGNDLGNFIRVQNGNDVVYGNGGADIVIAGDGRDLVTLGSGTDTIWGGSGRDTLSSGAGNDKVGSSSGDDSVVAGDGNDTIWGGTGRDTLLGEGGDDIIWGGTGEDVLVGGSGNDTLGSGGAGDVMTGGEGRDVFVFFNDFGEDTITDFDGASGDRLLLGHWLWDDVGTLSTAQVVSRYAARDSSNTVLDFETKGTQITLDDYGDIDVLAQYIDIMTEPFV